MTKPITVARVEFVEAVVTAARESNLPAFVLADVLRDLRERLMTESEQQYRNDQLAWEAAQAEEESKDAGDDH